MARLLLILMALVGCAGTTQLRLYVGTYTRGQSESEGIYVLEFDSKSGELSEPRLAAKTANPSFVAVHPNQAFLYAVGQSAGKGGKRTGVVRAYAIDAETGGLEELNHQASGGRGPCHLTVDPTGQLLLVANYGGGSVGAFPVQPDGHLAEASAVVQHEGSSVHPKRQTRPHAHSINVDPANRFALAADLGLDQVLVYRLGASEGTLTPHGVAAVAPGAGPRHLAFHPTGKTAYVINELARTVTVFTFDVAAGTLTEIQTITTVPQGVTSGSTAEVRCSPDGRFLYGSNRGHDSIASFAIDPQTGKLIATGHVSTGGQTPRNFVLAPSGRWLLAANQRSNTIVVFRIDPDTGVPEPTGQVVEVPVPVCLRFWEG